MSLLFTKEVKDCESPAELKAVGKSLINEGETLKHDRTIRNRNKKRKSVNTQLTLCVAKCIRMAVSADNDKDREAYNEVGEHIKTQIEVINKAEEAVGMGLDWI
jgi:hypothetical protein